MANKKFSAFTNQAMTANSELVGFDGGANTRYTITQLESGLNIAKTKFVINLRFGFEEGTVALPTRLMSWNGNVELSSGTSEDGGSYYVNDAFQINKVILRYAGANAIAMTGTDALAFELVYLTPSSSGPNSWNAVANSPSSPQTSISNFSNNLDLTTADNGTFPWRTFTPGTPISINADSMLMMKATETSSINPANADLFIQLYCQYT